MYIDRAQSVEFWRYRSLYSCSKQNYYQNTNKPHTAVSQIGWSVFRYMFLYHTYLINTLGAQTQQLNIKTYGNYTTTKISCYPPAQSYRCARRNCERNQTEICFHIHRNHVVRVPPNLLSLWSVPKGVDSMATSPNRRDPIDLTWVCAPYWAPLSRQCVRV